MGSKCLETKYKKQDALMFFRNCSGPWLTQAWMPPCQAGQLSPSIVVAIIRLEISSQNVHAQCQMSPTFMNTITIT